MLVAFSGLKGSGKDTAASILIEEYGFTKVSFAEAVRELALIIDPIIIFEDVSSTARLSKLVTQFGWDKIKREIPEVRRLLQRLGTEGGRNFYHEDIWIEIVDKKFKDLSWDNTRYVITDCRFDNEVQFVRDKGGLLVWVERPGVESDGHASESPHIKDLASIVINNCSSIEDFQEGVRTVMQLRRIEPLEQRVEI